MGALSVDEIGDVDARGGSVTPPLFLIEALPDRASLVLAGPEGRHAARVRRIGVGEEIDLGDGAGVVARCRVTGVGSDELQLRVLRRTTSPSPDPRLVVVQALAKGERAELAVELLTEVGVDEIVPWAAQRSVVRWQAERGQRALERWRSTAREAAKQSRRPWVPEVGALADTRAVVGLIGRCASAYVLHESAAVSVGDVPLPASGQVALVVGPEGGVSDDELLAFARAGAPAVRLGPEVLRTSTAGAAAVAALSVRLARWS